LKSDVPADGSSFQVGSSTKDLLPELCGCALKWLEAAPGWHSSTENIPPPVRTSTTVRRSSKSCKAIAEFLLRCPCTVRFERAGYVAHTFRSVIAPSGVGRIYRGRPEARRAAQPGEIWQKPRNALQSKKAQNICSLGSGQVPMEQTPSCVSASRSIRSWRTEN
jgi:hypothetical protein